MRNRSTEDRWLLNDWGVARRGWDCWAEKMKIMCWFDCFLEMLVWGKFFYVCWFCWWRLCLNFLFEYNVQYLFEFGDVLSCCLKVDSKNIIIRIKKIGFLVRLYSFKCYLYVFLKVFAPLMSVMVLRLSGWSWRDVFVYGTYSYFR